MVFLFLLFSGGQPLVPCICMVKSETTEHAKRVVESGTIEWLTSASISIRTLLPGPDFMIKYSGKGDMTQTKKQVDLGCPIEIVILGTGRGQCMSLFDA